MGRASSGNCLGKGKKWILPGDLAVDDPNETICFWKCGECSDDENDEDATVCETCGTIRPLPAAPDVFYFGRQECVEQGKPLTHANLEHSWVCDRCDCVWSMILVKCPRCPDLAVAPASEDVSEVFELFKNKAKECDEDDDEETLEAARPCLSKMTLDELRVLKEELASSEASSNMRGRSSGHWVR